MWLVIAHVEQGLSSTLSDVFNSRGIDPEVRRPFLGDDLPRTSELDGLVVLGAPHGSADDGTDSLIRERSLLRDAAMAGVPTLGICFGAQLLAVALGGDVRRAAHPHLGPAAVHLTNAGILDPIAGSQKDVSVMNWYADEFVVPDASTVLATDAHGAPRAFRHGRNAYGVQFHAEVDDRLAGQVAVDAKREPFPLPVVQASEPHRRFRRLGLV